MSMQSILSAGQSINRMQLMQSARTQMNITAITLRTESKLDGGNEKKDAQAKSMDEESNKLMDHLTDEFTDVNETLKPDEDIKTETDTNEEVKETEKTEESENQPKTDTLELSDSATKYLSETSHPKASALDAVTYKADGSATPSVPTKNPPRFKVTV